MCTFITGYTIPAAGFPPGMEAAQTTPDLIFLLLGTARRHCAGKADCRGNSKHWQGGAILFMCMSVWVCAHVCSVHRCPKCVSDPIGGESYRWLWATQCGCWRSNPAPPQVLFTDEPFLSLVPLFSFNYNFVHITHYLSDVWNTF